MSKAERKNDLQDIDRCADRNILAITIIIRVITQLLRFTDCSAIFYYTIKQLQALFGIVGHGIDSTLVN